MVMTRPWFDAVGREGDISSGHVPCGEGETSVVDQHHVALDGPVATCDGAAGWLVGWLVGWLID